MAKKDKPAQPVIPPAKWPDNFGATTNFGRSPRPAILQPGIYQLSEPLFIPSKPKG